MASFQKYNTKKGQLWMFKVDVGINPETGRRQTTTRRGFKTKKEAQIAASTLVQEITTGFSLNNDYLTYEEVYNEWFSIHSATIKTSTRRTIESKFRQHILPRLGKLRIRSITRSHCQRVINDIAQLIKSVNDIKIQINQVFKYAIKLDILQRNPMEYIVIPKQARELVSEIENHEERNFWDRTEVRQFEDIAKETLSYKDRVLFRLLIYTGARKGEILALTWDDINFEGEKVNLNKTLFYDKGEFIFQTSKTKESRRTISLDSVTLSLLNTWRIKQAEERLAHPYPYPKNMIFTRYDGLPLRLAYPNEKLSSIIKKFTLQRITIHGLRHTHASLLFEAGANIKEVQERLGHSDIKVTMNIYTHVTEQVKEETADKFRRYIELDI